MKKKKVKESVPMIHRNNYSNYNEANPKHPVSIANCVVSAFTLGGCHDFALLGALRDSWYDGHA